MKKKNNNLKFVLVFISGLLVSFAGTTFAASQILALNVDFTPRDTTWNVNNAEAAINDLYSRAGKSWCYSIESDKSPIFSSLTATAVNSNSDIVVTINPTFKTGYSASNVYEYILSDDGEAIARTTTTSVSINNYTAGKRYNLRVIAVDKEIKTHKGSSLVYDAPVNSFTKTILQYPIITSSGIKNVKYVASPDTTKSYYAYDSTVEVTASDALPRAAYDGNSSTGAGPYNVTYKYLDIDPSAYGKTFTFTTNGKYWAYYTPSAVDGRSTSKSFTIPNNLTRLKVYGNEGLIFYEMTVQ